MEKFVEQFYNEYGFYPPEGINSWEEWNNSQDYVKYLQYKASLPRELDEPISFDY